MVLMKAEYILQNWLPCGMIEEEKRFGGKKCDTLNTIRRKIFLIKFLAAS